MPPDKALQRAGLESLTSVPSEQVFSTACGRHPDRQKKSCITRKCFKTLDHERKLAQIL